MNTKMTKLTGILLLAMTALTTAESVAESGGATSTTGGGDWWVRATDLLPAALELRALYDVRHLDPKRMPSVGTRRCRAILSCTSYAHFFETRQEYDASLLRTQPESHGITVSVTGYGDLSRGDTTSEVLEEQQGLPEKLERTWWWDPIHLSFASGSRWLEKEMSFAPAQWEEQHNRSKPVRYRIVWERQPLSLEEFFAEIGRIRSTLLNQLDFAQLETVGQLRIFDGFLDSMLIESERSVPKADTRLADTITEEGNALVSLGEAVVDEDGNCDVDAMREFFRQRQAFRTEGSCAAEARIRTDLGIELPESARNCEEFSQRADRLITSEIIPACFANGTELRPEEVRIIIQEARETPKTQPAGAEQEG